MNSNNVKSIKTLVAICSLANFVNAADRVLMPICIVQMARQFEWDLTFQGWVLSGFGVGYVSSQVMGGKASMWFGGKRVLLVAVFVWSTATFLTPFAAHYPVLLIGTRVLLGFAEGFGLPAIFQIFSQNVLKDERGRAFSYLVSLGSVGQMMASLICPHMQWEYVFWLFGTAGIVWCCLWSVFISRCHSGDNQLDYLAFPHKSESSVLWSEYVRHRSLWAIYVAHFCMNWSNYTLMSWLPTYLAHAFHAQPDEISLTALPYVFNSFFGVVAGHYADYLVNRKSWTTLSVRRLMTTLGLLGPALFTLFFSFAKGIALAVLFISLSMAFCACNSPGHLSNHADVAPFHASVTFAVSNTMASVPGITAGPVTAAIVEYSGQWQTVFLLNSLVNIVGAVVYFSHSGASQII